MSDDAAYQSLRGFISLLDRTHPGEVVRIAEPVRATRVDGSERKERNLWFS